MPLNTLPQVRARLAELAPQIAVDGHIQPAAWQSFGRQGKLATAAFVLATLALGSGVYTYLGVRSLLDGSATLVFFAAVIYSVSVSVAMYGFWAYLIRFLPEMRDGGSRLSLVGIMIVGSAMIVAMSSWLNAAALAGSELAFGIVTALLGTLYFAWFGGLSGMTVGQRWVGGRPASEPARRVDLRGIAIRTIACATADVTFIRAVGAWIGIPRSNDDTRDPCRDDRVRARRRPAVVGTRLERHVERRAARPLPRRRERAEQSEQQRPASHARSF